MTRRSGQDCPGGIGRAGAKAALWRAFCALVVLAGAQESAIAAPPGSDSTESTADTLATVFAAAGAAANRHFCAILLMQEGAIRANVDNTEISSHAFGGRPAEAEITATNSSFRLSIDPVLGFTSAPAGAEAGTTFAPSYSGSGATGFSETPWNIPVQIKKGTTRALVNFNASNTADGFPAGTYQADLTLRCE